MPVRFVLDSFAVMALLLDEQGAARVEELLEGAGMGEHELYITVVNLGEVLYTFENRRDMEAAQEALAFVDQSPIEIVEVDRSLALNAARLKATTGMGYVDCFVAGCAQRLDAAVVTGDPDFRRVEDLVAIEWLPGAEEE